MSTSSSLPSTDRSFSRGRSLESLRSLFSDPKFLEEYDRWRSNPVTLRVFSAAREVARPVNLGDPSSEAALYFYGTLVGFTRMLDFVEGADRVLGVFDGVDAEASYGAEEILKKTREKRTIRGARIPRVEAAGG